MTRKEFKVEIAKKMRNCLHCGGLIEKNEACLTFKYGESYYSITANLCRVCILEIQEEIYQINIGTIKKQYQKLTKIEGTKKHANCNR